MCCKFYYTSYFSSAREGLAGSNRSDYAQLFHVSYQWWFIFNFLLCLPTFIIKLLRWDFDVVITVNCSDRIMVCWLVKACVRAKIYTYWWFRIRESVLLVGAVSQFILTAIRNYFALIDQTRQGYCYWPHHFVPHSILTLKISWPTLCLGNSSYLVS